MRTSKLLSNVFRELDQKLGLTESFASQIEDGRCDPNHSLLSVIHQRIFGIIAGDEDQNDHDTLRSDPVFKLITGRTVDDPDLASQPTISRVENSVTPADLLRLLAACQLSFESKRRSGDLLTEWLTVPNAANAKPHAVIADLGGRGRSVASWRKPLNGLAPNAKMTNSNSS